MHSSVVNTVNILKTSSHPLSTANASYTGLTPFLLTCGPDHEYGSPSLHQGQPVWVAFPRQTIGYGSIISSPFGISPSITLAVKAVTLAQMG